MVQILLALFVSLTLIGGASWFRFAQAIEYSPNLVIVDEQNQDHLIKNTLLEGLSSSATSSNTSLEPLSETDLVSRQLFFDYIQLASQGQATPSNLNSLAAKYTGSILDSKIFHKVDQSQITTVFDSVDNLKTYNQKIFALRSKYTNLMSSAFSQRGFTDIEDPNFKSLMIYAGELYQQAAKELAKLPVPNSLADNHIKLIENYLSSSEALGILTDISKDPIRTYAALNVYAQNTEAENGLLSNIQIRILGSQGMFNSDI